MKKHHWSVSKADLELEFCSICGTGVLGEHFEGPLKGRVVVNVRTLRGVDPFEFE